MLNKLWPIFIILSIAYGIITGKIEDVNNAIFESTESAVELCLTLLGTMCLWSGIMEIASKTKLIDKINKALGRIHEVFISRYKKRR